MSLWRRRPTRSAYGWMGLSSPWVSIAQSGYADIDATRLDVSLQSVAVRTAVDLIASLGSELPVDVFSGKGRDKRQRPMPAWLEDPGGDGYGLADWSYRVLMSWLLRGNLYGETLDVGPGGFLRQVEIFHPDCVSGWMEDGAPVWTVNGRRVERNFVHRRAFPIPGQIQGISPVAYHASTIGVSLAATQFGRQWFGDGGHPTGILRNTEVPLEAEGNVKTAKRRFLAALRGIREPLVLGKGWEYQQIQVAPEDSQFLETMGYTEAQCARIFGPGIAEVLGYAVKGSSLTYSNLADRDLQLLKYAVGKWLRRLERLLSQFLPKPQYVLLNRDALLETTTMQRYQAHAVALGGGAWKSVNEVRDDEDEPPVDWGEGRPGAGAAPAPAPTDEQPPAGGPDDPGQESEDEA
jgi:HK97 family phage portal protein